VDDYHGISVADAYRWLEDDRSAETAAWVDAENKVTYGYLERIPYRQQLKDRLESLYNYPRYTAPFRRGENFFFSKNDGLQNQNVLYIQEGLEGTPEVLLDPNQLSSDGTSRLVQAQVSRDGRYLAYAISRGGSDWEEVRILEIATRRGLDDHLQWIKVSGLAWAGDGFFYSRYDAPGAGEELSAVNENHKVFYHRLNTPQSEDELIYENEGFPQRFHTVSTTEDERFAILTISDRGAGKDGNALFFRDLSSNEKTFVPIVAEISDDQYGVIDHVGGKFLIATNHRAPNHKVLLFDAASPADPWKEILPERAEPLEAASTAGGKLFATYTKDVTTRAFAYQLDGTLENEIALAGAGSACGFSGLHDDRFVFYSFTSFNFPPAIFLYDIAAKSSAVFREPDIPGFDPEAYESKEIFYSSQDGTRVPMFLVYKKGLKLDGNNPTLLYAYGGFNISLPPNFSSLRLALLEQGFVYASANIRGGSEYGETWHQGGMKLQKQNVFDDFIAAAEWLIANKYTSPAKLAINGASNGGLLVGAVMNQRPELFSAAVPQVGVMDMLRFQKFTIGWNWIADYGSSDDPREFKALYAYSPLQNIRAGVKYPATLITTADHDDRVVPAHSFKYAATLQEKASAENPVLIRIDTKSGHGASNTSKQIELMADIYAFLFYSLGVTPQF
jgi:prolyl oligopeptidase